ncbi:MAG: ATP synthase F1 subunit epsilon [Chitinophagales bacterium]|nr:ATP synthase F1 subunit epsilon [Chitinophagales bacterium]MCZ2392286.1 ATP synthase F1 subunit epsilon [Chitinophagales bacterium]
MQLDILTPEGKVYSGEADAVQLPGLDGLFQILNNHAPLIAALAEGVVKVQSKNEKKTFNIKTGIVEVFNNKISVLTEGVA